MPKEQGNRASENGVSHGLKDRSDLTLYGAELPGNCGDGLPRAQPWFLMNAARPIERAGCADPVFSGRKRLVGASGLEPLTPAV